MSDLHRAKMAESKLDWIRRWIVAHDLKDDLRPIITTIDAEVWDGYQTIPTSHAVRHVAQPLDHKEP